MHLSFATLIAIAGLALCQPPQYVGTRHLWYDWPGWDFNSALPLGNGRLGALVFGSPSEKIILNENSVWSGPFQDRINPDSLDAFPKVRDYLKKGQLTKANDLVIDHMSCSPDVSRSYSVTNNLNLDFGHYEQDWSNYTRWLDTAEGIMGVSYDYEGVTYGREYVANFPVGVIAVRLTASEAGKLGVKVSLSRDRGIVNHSASTNPNTIVLDVGGSDAGSIAFSSAVRIQSDGDVATSNDGKSLEVTGASRVDLFYDAETEFQWDSESKYKAEVNRKLNAAASAGFNKLWAQAKEDHSNLMNRVTLDLGSSGEAGRLRTDRRVSKYQNDPRADNEFITLMFNFGRHLLISSSRDTGGPGLGVPANLQGIWNDNYQPAWGSKFTVNINTEMNYWLAETTNLVETLPPLWDLLERSRQRGKDVAKRMYGCPGYVSHHNLDLWGDSAPHDHGIRWTMWPMSNLWLTSHMMEHYRFTGDKEFLRNTAWPLFEDAAAFFNCYIFEHEGYHSTGPSISPENFFYIPRDMAEEGLEGAIDISPTMDNSLLYDFFTNYVEIASALGISGDDNKMVTKALDFRSGLRPTAIGRHGQVQEWRNDYAEKEENHRHISHLWDLFPGSAMSPLLNKTLSEAARVSIQRRLDAGGAGTGWSRAWTAACFARLLDGDASLDQTRTLLRYHPMNNLLHRIEGNDWTFQIDSNFGLVAVVAEWLVQSHAGVVHLLPALGSDLPAGSVKGLVARGGFVVDLSWDDGMLSEAKIKSTRGGRLAVRVSDGKAFKVDGKEVNAVDTEPGKIYRVTL
ncbi:hypothetical protein NW759_016184 [Fusarium solani]|nr:hypothetical protein NW759_016184 [Fusarium solani]